MSAPAKSFDRTSSPSRSRTVICPPPCSRRSCCTLRRHVTSAKLSGFERREDLASALFGRLRTGVAGQVVLDTGVDHVDLRPRFTCDPVPSCPLSFFEDGDWRQNADEEPLEAGELAPPPVEPTAIDEDVVHEHVIPAARARRDRRTHPGGKLLADGAGNDRRVVPPKEPFRSARAVLHPPLVDRAPERIDPEPEPRLV